MPLPKYFTVFQRKKSKHNSWEIFCWAIGMRTLVFNQYLSTSCLSVTVMKMTMVSNQTAPLSWAFILLCIPLIVWMSASGSLYPFCWAIRCFLRIFLIDFEFALMALTILSTNVFFSLIHCVYIDTNSVASLIMKKRITKAISLLLNSRSARTFHHCGRNRKEGERKFCEENYNTEESG